VHLNNLNAPVLNVLRLVNIGGGLGGLVIKYNPSKTRHNGYDMTPPIPHNLNPVDDNTTLHCLENLKTYTEILTLLEALRNSNPVSRLWWFQTSFLILCTQ